MKKTLILLCLVGVLFAQDLDLSTLTTKFDQGTKLFMEDKGEDALIPFGEAKDGLEQMLSGVLTPDDEAYAKYYLAYTYYHIARINNDNEVFETTWQGFFDAARVFSDQDNIAEEYIRSKYMQALCSFRQYQLASNERNQMSTLDKAKGDFIGFVENEHVLANAEEYQFLIDNAYCFLGYCQYMLGYLKSFNMGQLSTARGNYNGALESFGKAKNSTDERVSLAATYMEANCNYMLARLYMRVSEDDWATYKLPGQNRLTAIEGALSNSLSAIDGMISASGTQKDLQMFGKVSGITDKIYVGSTGDKQTLNGVLTDMTDMRSDATWGGEIMNRLADGRLLNFLIFNTPAQGAVSGMNAVLDDNPEALYWTGMIKYCMGEYDQANAKLGAFFGRTAANRTTRIKELKADAKFRQAESMFWMAIKQGNTALLTQADGIYKALESESGEYNEYLGSETKNIVTIRRFLITIETSLGKQQDASLFDVAMDMAGFSLPKDAEKYLAAGNYFLQKGIESAERERETALRFAIRAFSQVLSASVSSEVKNRARFMKGVALVKLATVQDENQAETIGEAQAVLNACTSPYTNEAKYVVGRGYFNINDYTKAIPILQQLKGKGHIRATYYYAIIQIEKNNNSVAAGALTSIKATVKDRSDYWYNKADLELAKISASPTGGGAMTMLADPPMTYENLVDEEAEKARKKKESLFIWQRSSRFKEVPDINELIPDRPPETNVNLEIAIVPPEGDVNIIIDDKEGLVSFMEKGVYKVNLNRGTHSVLVRKKGFYLYKKDIKVSKSERITLTLNKAVRYIPDGEMSGTKNALAVAAKGDELFVAPVGSKSIKRYKKDRSKRDEYRFSDLGIGGVSGIAVDEENLIIVDAKQNQVIMLMLSGKAQEPEPEPEPEFDDTTTEKSDSMAIEEPVPEPEPVKKGPGLPVKVIAYSGETYGSFPLSRPAGVCVHRDMYYIADAGNSRILVFEGSTFKKEIGLDTLVRPMDVAAKDEMLYVADLGKGMIVKFSLAGEFIDEVELESQTQPAAVFVSEEGFVFVSDYVKNDVIKYTDELKPISIAAKNVTAPRTIAQIGTGPSSMLYVADAAGLSILKGKWDENFMPED